MENTGYYQYSRKLGTREEEWRIQDTISIQDNKELERRNGEYRILYYQYSRQLGSEEDGSGEYRILSVFMTTRI